MATRRSAVQARATAAVDRARSWSRQPAARNRRGGRSPESFAFGPISAATRSRTHCWRIGVRSRSASMAKACTVFPLFCLTGASATKSPAATRFVSSVNSRRAVATRSLDRPGSTRPLGIVQAPSSFLAQNGPPGCPSRTSNSLTRRNTTSPALISAVRGIGRSAISCGYLPQDILCRSCQIGPCLHDFVTITPTMPASHRRLLEHVGRGGGPIQLLHGS